MRITVNGWIDDNEGSWIQESHSIKQGAEQRLIIQGSACQHDSVDVAVVLERGKKLLR